MATARDSGESLPVGIRVLNTNDDEPGTSLNGYSFDSATGWFEYEVETQYGVERWLRSEFVLLSEAREDA